MESLTCASAVEECSEHGCLALSLLELLALNMMFIFISSLLVLIEVRTSQANMFKNNVIKHTTPEGKTSYTGKKISLMLTNAAYI